MIAERDRFYSDQVAQSSIPMQMPGEKAIHGKMKPDKAEDEGEKEKLTTIKEMPKREEHQPLRSNQNYIHKVMAPSFLTDNENNISYSKG